MSLMMGQVTWLLPFQGQFLGWDLLCSTHVYIKFEMSTITSNEEMKA